MKKVCHIISGHYRNDIRVLKKQCISLFKNGYDVSILCADGKDDEVIDNIKIHSIAKPPKNRFSRFFCSTKKIFNEAIQVNADIYQVHEPCLLGVAKKLKMDGKKVIFDSHEDTVQDILGKQYIPKIFRSVVAKIYSIKEKHIVKKLDAVFTVTPAIVDRFKLINPNTYMITNYPIADIIIDNKDYCSREDAICFAGLAEPVWNIHIGIDSIENLDCKFNLATCSCSEDYYNLLKNMPAFNKVRYFTNLSFEEVIKKIYNKSTIGVALINYNSNFSGKKGSLGNTKVFEYMMFGLPIVCTDFDIWKEVVQDNKCGICVKPNNVDEAYNAIKYLIENKQEADKMGKNGQKLIKEKYNWSTQEKILLEAYSKL